MCVAESAEKTQLELGTHCMRQHRKFRVTVFAPKVTAKSVIYPKELNFKIQSCYQLLILNDSKELSIKSVLVTPRTA